MNTSSPRHHTTRALVLGGGGSSGNAWSIGVLAGLREAGVDVTSADLVVGTSAGSTTAVQVTSTNPAELLADILAVTIQPSTMAGRSDRPASNRPVTDQLAATGAIIAAADDAADMRRRLGAAALDQALADMLPAGPVARHRRRSAADPDMAAAAAAHHRRRRRDR